MYISAKNLQRTVLRICGFALATFSGIVSSARGFDYGNLYCPDSKNTTTTSCGTYNGVKYGSGYMKTCISNVYNEITSTGCIAELQALGIAPYTNYPILCGDEPGDAGHLRSSSGVLTCANGVENITSECKIAYSSGSDLTYSGTCNNSEYYIFGVPQSGVNVSSGTPTYLACIVCGRDESTNVINRLRCHMHYGSSFSCSDLDTNSSYYTEIYPLATGFVSTYTLNCPTDCTLEFQEYFNKYRSENGGTGQCTYDPQRNHLVIKNIEATGAMLIDEFCRSHGITSGLLQWQSGCMFTSCNSSSGFYPTISGASNSNLANGADLINYCAPCPDITYISGFDSGIINEPGRFTIHANAGTGVGVTQCYAYHQQPPSSGKDAAGSYTTRWTNGSTCQYTE